MRGSGWIQQAMLFLLMASAVSSNAATTAAAQPTFTNAIVIPGADPWIVIKDGSYWFTATAGNRIDIRRSRTLAGLGAATPATIWRAPATGPKSRDVWAPEFHRVGKRWLVYFTATDEQSTDANRRIYALESATDDLQGRFIDRGRVAVPGDDHYAIDGTLLQRSDGRLFFLWSGRERSEKGPQNIYIAPMSDPWTINGPRVRLSTPDHDWEKHGWHVNEGPEVLQQGGKTFVVYSGSGYTTPEYSLGLLRNTDGDLLNPLSWTKSVTPVFAAYEGKDGQVFGPGHNGFFKSPDGSEDWIVYHAWDKRDTRGLQRSARAQRFTWRADGTPDFGRPIPPGVPLPVPAGERLE